MYTCIHIYIYIYAYTPHIVHGQRPQRHARLTDKEHSSAIPVPLDDLHACMHDCMHACMHACMNACNSDSLLSPSAFQPPEPFWLTPDYPCK